MIFSQCRSGSGRQVNSAQHSAANADGNRHVRRRTV
jgi:hypothetical protein